MELLLDLLYWLEIVQLQLEFILKLLLFSLAYFFMTKVIIITIITANHIIRKSVIMIDGCYALCLDNIDLTKKQSNCLCFLILHS